METHYLSQLLSLHYPKNLQSKRFQMSNSWTTARFSQEVKIASVISRLRSPHCSIQQMMSPFPTLDSNMDLKITINKTVVVSPTEETKRKTTFLSNIDQQLNFMSSTVQFFDMNPGFPFETLVSKLEMAYRKLLVAYDFLAGRLRWNTEVCRLEIDCNSAGAGFVVASSELRLEEMGDLEYPKRGYQQLAQRKLKSLLHPDDQPLVIIQVTSFKCGGFTLGFTVNHIALDGIGCKYFLQNMASMVERNVLVLVPYNNRQLLAARSPPHVDFLHPEIIDLKSMQGGETSPIQLVATFKKHQCKVFKLSSCDITMLKKLAEMEGECSAHNGSIFNLVAAHIWRCIAQAKNLENDAQKTSTLLYAVNIRPIVRPRLPTTYSGNAILNSYWTTTCGELEERPLSNIIEMISKAATRMTDKYIRSIIDLGEFQKGFLKGDLIITSWLKHGLNEIDYPWGRAKWTSPVVPSHGNSATILLPDIKGTRNYGMNIQVSLPCKEMENFQNLFYKF